MLNSIIFISLIIIINNAKQPEKDPKDFLSDVIIDMNGDFKYILMEMYNKNNTNDYKFLVRGSNEFSYHKILYLSFMQNSVYKYPEMYLHYNFKVLGGGRICFKGDTILVYGESGEYGRANHKMTANLLKIAFPNFNVETLD